MRMETDGKKFGHTGFSNFLEMNHLSEKSDILACDIQSMLLRYISKEIDKISVLRGFAY